jgi:hypothetical protein
MTTIMTIAATNITTSTGPCAISHSPFCKKHEHPTSEGRSALTVARLTARSTVTEKLLNAAHEYYNQSPHFGAGIQTIFPAPDKNNQSFPEL